MFSPRWWPDQDFYFYYHLMPQLGIKLVSVLLHFLGRLTNWATFLLGCKLLQVHLMCFLTGSSVQFKQKKTFWVLWWEYKVFIQMNVMQVALSSNWASSIVRLRSRILSISDFLCWRATKGCSELVTLAYYILVYLGREKQRSNRIFIIFVSSGSSCYTVTFNRDY